MTVSCFGGADPTSHDSQYASSKENIRKLQFEFLGLFKLRLRQTATISISRGGIPWLFFL